MFASISDLASQLTLTSGHFNWCQTQQQAYLASSYHILFYILYKMICKNFGIASCMIKIFMGRGVVDGEGVTLKDA